MQHSLVMQIRSRLTSGTASPRDDAPNFGTVHDLTRIKPPLEVPATDDWKGGPDLPQLFRRTNLGGLTPLWERVCAGGKVFDLVKQALA
jgi:hypothetical protein